MNPRLANESPVVQVLGTEHWSLLATRSMTWSEIFSRTNTFLTVLSATVVALSLIVNGTGYGTAFHAFALTCLPVALLVGYGTYSRLVEADIEDAWLVIGMNRIRHAYIELVPEVAPYLVTGVHDDEPGLLQTYSFHRRVGLGHWLSGSPVIVAIIDAVVAGVLAGIAADALSAPATLRTVAGLGVGLLWVTALAYATARKVGRIRRDYQPRFPAGSSAGS